MSVSGCSDNIIGSGIIFDQRLTNVLLNDDMKRLLVFLAFVHQAEFRSTDFRQYTLPCSTHIPYKTISESYNFVSSILSETVMLYTVSQKTIHLTFDRNCGKCRPMFEILSPTDSQRNLYVTIRGSSTSP